MSEDDTFQEAARLAALTACEVMDTGRETAFDNIVFTASQLFRAPWTRLTLVDSTRAWAKAQVGSLPQNCPRRETLCSYVVESRRLLVIEDTTTDARFASIPAVADEPRIRFFAGAPLLGPANHVLGALCVFDRLPRSVPERQQGQLMQLASEASELLRLRVADLDLSA